MNEIRSIVLQIAIVLIGIAFLLCTSGRLVRFILNYASNKTYEAIVQRKLIYYDTMNTPTRPKNKKYIRDYTGSIIGKCENLIVFIFIALDQYTALALIFTAKTVVRAEAIRSDPLYYLAGTMINISYSIVVTIIIKLLIEMI